MSPSIPVTLPGGYWRNGVRHRDAMLRPLTGRDEVFLVEDAEALSPAQRTTAILVRCLERLGGEAVSDDVARKLTAGDREAALLHLRRATFGDELSSVIRCPHEGCGERMDLDLRVSDLVVPPSPEVVPVYEKLIASHAVRFRLPNGADLEEAAAIVVADQRAAVRHVLKRCIEAIDGERPDTIPDVVSESLPGIMADLDAQAELVLHLVCTRCERPFTAIFDTATFLFGELAAHRDTLYREVHQLAFHYHWSESDILAMTAPRRRRYLDLLAEALPPRGKR